MITFASTRDNDFLIKDGSMRLSSGVVAVAMTARHYAQTMLGEMIHKTKSGIPFWPTVFDRVSEAQFVAGLRLRIMELPEVTELRDLSVVINDGMLQYTVTLVTIYGQEVLEGGVQLPN